MELRVLDGLFSICRLKSAPQDTGAPFWFFSRTDEELSLICPTDTAPEDCEKREDGWRGLRIQGKLDFSMVGVLARITEILAAAQLSVCAVSTFDTDYLFVREKALPGALSALKKAGYTIQG